MSISAKSFRPQNSLYFLRKPTTRNSRTNGWSFPLVWSREGGGEEWVRLGRKRKIRLKKYDRNWQRKNKRKKEKRQLRRLKAVRVEKLVLPNRSCWSITKRQKCLTLKLNIYHKKLKMKECTYLTCNRPSDSWEKAKKSELEKKAKGRG